MEHPSRVLVIDGPAAVAPPAGAAVTRAADLNEAWQLLADGAFDAVLVPAPVLQTLRTSIQSSEHRQQKLQALHRAGSNLTDLDAEHLAEISVENRVETLKHNLRRAIHDLLAYDILEIRLLNRSTLQLIPLLEVGMSEEAASRVLYARPEGNGVTGYVAATAVSYLCPDTTTDPLYLRGAHSARSSLTIPLLIQGEVIGTFNVESPHANGFSLEDLQFTELFGREVAQSLHTLQLLTAQQTCTVAESINAIHREIALPADDLLAVASRLHARLGDADPEVAEALGRILAAARLIKANIHKVGDDLNALPSKVHAAKGMNPLELKGKRVLVVDAEERTRLLAHSFLDRFGCQVETAATGQAGLALARYARYDAVLTDIRLPDLRGYEAFCRFRELQPHARLVLLTEFGYDASHSIIKARQDGLRHVLLKPLHMSKLVESLLGPGASAPPQAHVRDDGPVMSAP